VVGHVMVTGKAAAAFMGVPALQTGPPAAVTCQSVPGGSPLRLLVIKCSNVALLRPHGSLRATLKR
jgi:hypothetical protein